MKNFKLTALKFGATEVLSRDQLKNIKGGSPTCMQRTSSFGSCMSCVVNECANDWACAIGCGVEAGGCAAVMAASCAAAQYKR